MYYVQYYNKIGNDYVEACGDRSILILDGRNNLDNMCQDAEDHNGFRRPYYDAYRIFKGASILRSSPITELKRLSHGLLKNIQA